MSLLTAALRSSSSLNTDFGEYGAGLCEPGSPASHLGDGFSTTAAHASVLPTTPNGGLMICADGSDLGSDISAGPSPLAAIMGDLRSGNTLGAANRMPSVSVQRLPPAPPCRAIPRRDDCASSGSATAMQMARSCPRPIMASQRRGPTSGRTGSGELDDTDGFIPPHELVGSLMAAGAEAAAFSLSRKGSAALRMRSAVLQRTGFVDGRTECVAAPQLQ